MKTTIKHIGEITGYNVPASLPFTEKYVIAASYINPTKYGIVGFVDRTNLLVLAERFYNVRDGLGRFAKVRKSRR